MFVRVEEDVINKALAGNQFAIETLHLIATGIRKNKHWYHIPRLATGKLKNLLSEHERKLFASVVNNDTNSMAKCVEWELIVSFNEPTPPTGKVIIWYNPQTDSNFEIYEEIHLLCENLNDVEFYKNFITFYKHNTGKNIFQHGDTKFLARNGGGDTTAHVLENEILRAEHLVLVITDSDYRYIEADGTPGALGKTAQAIENVINEHQSPFCQHYHLKQHREAENLIPFRILEDIPGPSRQQKALFKDLANDLRLFDFKEGLTYTDLYGHKIYDYWKRVLSGKKDISFRETIRPLGDTQTVEEYKKKLLENKAQSGEASKPIFTAWGSSVLENATLKLKRLKGKDKLQPRDLTPLQYEEWNAIGKLLFNWALVREDKRRYP